MTTEQTPLPRWDKLVTVKDPQLLFLFLAHGRTYPVTEVQLFSSRVIKAAQINFKTTPPDCLVTQAEGYQMWTRLSLSPKEQAQEHQGYYNADRVEKIAKLVRESGYKDTWTSCDDDTPYKPGMNPYGFKLNINGQHCSVSVEFGYKDAATANEITEKLRRNYPGMEPAGPNSSIVFRIMGIDDRASDIGGVKIDGKSYFSEEDFALADSINNQVSEYARISGVLLGALHYEAGQSISIPLYNIGVDLFAPQTTSN
jgi:hypothetical protein